MPTSPIDGAIRALAPHVPALNIFDIDLGSPDGCTLVTWSRHPAITGADWAHRARASIAALPDGGLLAGYLGYEAGRTCEVMPEPTAPRPLPDVWLRPCDGHLEWSARRGSWRIRGTPDFQAEARALLSLPPRPVGTRHAPWAVPLQGPATRFQDAVQAALAQILDGEVYQVNLSWEALGPPLANPLDAWLHLRADNPARRGAYLEIGPQQTILSNSPETFIDVVPSGDHLTARSVPIKGTVRRDSGRAGWNHLEHSEKERAELTMIVDLVRNDLGRVAPWGRVQTGPRTLRVCGDLVHAEQTVEAPLRAGVDAIGAIEATFPPGSVTGAPKVRAMQLIQRLESGPRGVYTGAIGAFLSDGSARTSVAIRTATCTPSHTRFHVGAGIVADSEPLAEWEETLAKGGRLHAVLHAAPVHQDPHAPPA